MGLPGGDCAAVPQSDRFDMKKIFPVALIASVLLGVATVTAQPLRGEKSSWHGFVRYDYVIDEGTLAISPVVKSDAEGDGVAAPLAGTRRCIVVAPREAAPGNPWTWRGCYWDHEPQAELELLRRGFHVVFIHTDPDTTWDAWYDFLVREWGLSSKAAFIGMSRGGSNAYTWGTANPERVFAIYADNPAITPEALWKMHLLAESDVPLLNICGSTDPILEYTRSIEDVYHAAGGRMSVLLKDGPAHHPHSLRDPAQVADFIERSFAELSAVEESPVWLPERHESSWFYGTKRVYGYNPSEEVWTSSWGPLFGGAYRKYSFNLGELRWLTVYAPAHTAEGMPWVWRADIPERISEVDLGLLAAGYHIVVGPVPTSRGPVMEQWDDYYDYLTSHGFSPKPVMAGGGAATGEVYVWAERNPDKVACIYGENPILRASIAPVPPMDNLAPLAAAGVPIIHVCGSLDPNLESQTREVERRYKALGGEMTVIVDPARGHLPLSPTEPARVVELILSTASL
jgi:hypothetical protein